MKTLFKIIVLHGAPKDSWRNVETYLYADDAEAVLNWLEKEKHYGNWFTPYDPEDEPKTGYVQKDGGDTVEVPFREYLLTMKGDLEDENGWEDAYYGVTKWGWEEFSCAPEDAQVLIRLGIAQEI